MMGYEMSTHENEGRKVGPVANVVCIRPDIRVTGVSLDEDLPLAIRESLVGLVIPCPFTIEDLEGQRERPLEIKISAGSRLAYIEDITRSLYSAGKNDAAAELRKTYNPRDMYSFEREIYELVKRT